MFADVNAEPGVPGSASWWRDRYLRRLRGAGRGLNIEGICRTALEIVDRGGPGELTMRRLADELGTGPASLYRHFSSRDELLVEVADLVLGELPAPDPALGWRDAVEGLAHGLRRVLVGHRGIVVLTSSVPMLGPNAMRVRELFWGAMLRDRCDPELAVQTYASVVHLVVCSAIFSAHASRRSRGPLRGTGNELPELLDVLPARRYPTVLQLSEYVERPDPEHDFAVALRALLNGLSSSSVRRGAQKRDPVGSRRRLRPART